MNRQDFQNLATIRVREAGILLDNGCFQGAYYLAGYAVECGFKACIAKQTRQFDFPPKPETVRKMYVHNLVELLGYSGLKFEFEAKIRSNRIFADNWLVVKDWTEEARYRPVVPELIARNLFTAVAAEGDGVLQWIMRSW